MTSQSWFESLLPEDERNEPAFRDELERQSVTGLRLSGAVLVVITLCIWLVSVALPLAQTANAAEVASTVLFFGLGLGAVAISFWERSKTWARSAGIVLGYLVGTIDIAVALYWPGAMHSAQGAHSHFVINLAFILLILLAVFPLKPIHVFALEVLLFASYLGMVVGSGRVGELTGMEGVHVFMSLPLLFVVTALTARVYKQRAETFRARRLAEESFELLRQAQARLTASENAASQARLAAALSHELNTPLGAMLGSLGTIEAAAEKLCSSPDRQDRARDALETAMHSARESSGRLKHTVERMKDLTHLDRATDLQADLNHLCSQTVILLQTELDRKAEVLLDLQPVPLVRCQPQLLSAVLSNLLRNAAAAMDSRGHIEVRTKQRPGEVVVEVRDDGRGIPAERLRTLFDPAFEVVGSRVATTNWGLFVARSIVSEHGGLLEIQSEERKGTTARIVLPATSPEEARDSD